MQAERRGRRKAQATPELPRRMLEVQVFPGSLEVTERYGDDHARLLEEKLRELGLPVELLFRSPCG